MNTETSYVEAKFYEAKTVLQSWVNKRGHDKCHYYPEIFRELAKIMEIPIPEDLELPPKEEFTARCALYRDEIYSKIEAKTK